MANDSMKDKLARRSFTGWQDVIGPPDQEVAAPRNDRVVDQNPPPDKGTLVRKTYLLRQAQVDLINAQAKENGLGINAYVRYLLSYILEEIDAGRVVVSAGTTSIERADPRR